jgi:hypothetical protein
MRYDPGMADEEWRALERAHAGAPADQVVLERLMQARRRAGLPIPARLLRAVSHEAFEIEVPKAFSLWFLPPRGPGAVLRPEPIESTGVPAHSTFGLTVTVRDLANPALLRSVVGRHRLPGIRVVDAGMSLADLGALRGLRSLTTVILSGTTLIDALAPLASLENLSTLVLDKTDVTGVGLAALSRLPALSVLEISSRNTGPTREGVAAIAMLSRLTDLSLERWGPGAEEGLPLLAGLTHLETLALRACPGVSPSDLTSLARQGLAITVSPS